MHGIRTIFAGTGTAAGWVLLATLAGCTGDADKGGDSGSPDGDTDTDTDSDTDADADADTDTDADADVDSLTGTVVHTRVEDGTTTCDESNDLVGTEYVGNCATCLFTFDIQSTQTSSTGDCEPNPVFTWSEVDGVQNIRLAFAETYEVYPYYTFGAAAVGTTTGTGTTGTGTTTTTGYTTYTGYTIAPVTVYDAILFGFDYVYGSTTYGPLWFVIGYDGGYPGDVSWDGVSNLGMNLAYAYDYNIYTHYNQFCGNFDYGIDLDTLDAGGGTAEDFDCSGSAFDVWEFDATQGQVMQIAVDNGAPADPADVSSVYFQITDGANCNLEYNAGSLECTEQPPAALAPPPYTTTGYYTYTPTAYCGTLEDTIAATGTYHVLVYGYGVDFSCFSGGGGASPYTLTGNLDGTPITFTPVADDAPFYEGTIAIEETSDLATQVTWTP